MLLRAHFVKNLMVYMYGHTYVLYMYMTNDRLIQRHWQSVMYCQRNYIEPYNTLNIHTHYTIHIYVHTVRHTNTLKTYIHNHVNNKPHVLVKAPLRVLYVIYCTRGAGLCLKCNKSRTCTSVNGALTGLQCRILSRLKKLRPLFLKCAHSPLRTPRKCTKIPSEVSQVLFKHPCVQSFAAMRLPVIRESVFFS